MSRNLQHNLLAVCLFALFTMTDQSIAGVTYKDDFDFEERYRNVNECNPMYWYPLHMPDACIQMYGKLIRSRISAKQPFKVVAGRDKEEQFVKDNQMIYKMLDVNVGQGSDDMSQEYGYLGEYQPYKKERLPPLPPHLYMIEKIRQDVRKVPAIPVLGYLPNIGLSAIYQQPVSDDTKNTIQEIGGEYAAAIQKQYQKSYKYLVPDPIKDKNCKLGVNNDCLISDIEENKDHENFVTTKPKHNNSPEIIEADPEDMSEEVTNKNKPDQSDKIALTNKKQNRNRTKPLVFRKKIQVGNFVAYIEKKKFFNKNFDENNDKKIGV